MNNISYLNNFKSKGNSSNIKQQINSKKIIPDISIGGNSLNQIRTIAKDENNVKKDIIYSKYDNYVLEKKYELINDLLREIGYKSLKDQRFISFKSIQNRKMELFIESMIPALKTVFKSYDIRSITRKGKDRRFCLNILRQLLKNIDYKLIMKTYPLIRNNTITSSTMYKIVKV